MQAGTSVETGCNVHQMARGTGPVKVNNKKTLSNVIALVAYAIATMHSISDIIASYHGRASRWCVYMAGAWLVLVCSHW